MTILVPVVYPQTIRTGTVFRNTTVYVNESETASIPCRSEDNIEPGPGTIVVEWRFDSVSGPIILVSLPDGRSVKIRGSTIHRFTLVIVCPISFNISMPTVPDIILFQYYFELSVYVLLKKHRIVTVKMSSVWFKM